MWFNSTFLLTKKIDIWVSDQLANASVISKVVMDRESDKME